MNILIISNLFPPGFIGGYELAAYDAANYLSESGHKVNVITSRSHLSAEREIRQYNVHRLLRCVTWDVEQNSHKTIVSEGLFASAQNIRILKDYFRDNNDVDVVLCFNLSGLGTVGIIHFLKLLSLPTCVYLMDNLFVDERNNYMSLNRFMDLTGARENLETTRWIAMSQTLLSEVRHFSKLEMSRNQIVPGWAETTSSELPVDIPTNCSDIAASKNHKRFVYCSRISETKGAFICLDACKSLLDAGVSDFSLDFYGNGDIDDLMRIIRERKLENHASYKGEVNKGQMLEYFSQYHALVFPTWAREPFGFVAAEAAAKGCIPILTAGTGASEWFIHGRDCIKISQSATSLFEAMFSFINYDYDKIASMKSEAKTTVRQFLDKSLILNNLENALLEERNLPRERPLELDCAENIITILSGQWKWLHS